MRLELAWMGHLPLRSFYYYPPHRHIVQFDLAPAALCTDSLVQTRSAGGNGPGSISGN